ncbi:DUF6266 family protein [Sphingobacterium sp. SRCM116780]|uniref:DUF6266 family protein n=1 Tax=Sphingobacterium sp. SRCM116780 TaxID=2907623 RepID=UPI001F38AFCE|nr:DUF6266 family protein [Sphingobacterium sp. SRCM116780]UIR56198.1 DUF6266 family protein [Sphingobacterium sp. SRCM116780]
MAIQKNGPNGSFKGKVGSIYGYELNGQHIIRGARVKNNNPPSEAVLMNRQKMKVANNFVKSIAPVLKYGYRHIAPKGSRIGAFQTAQRHILMETMEMAVDSQYYVNPEKVLVFRGSLYPPMGCSVEREGNFLRFNWITFPEYADKIYKMNVAFIEEDNLAQLEIGEAEVNQGTCTIALSSYMNNNKPIHVYLGIWNSYLDQLSDSVYCGVV